MWGFVGGCIRPSMDRKHAHESNQPINQPNPPKHDFYLGQDVPDVFGVVDDGEQGLQRHFEAPRAFWCVCVCVLVFGSSDRSPRRARACVFMRDSH